MSIVPIQRSSKELTTMLFTMLHSIVQSKNFFALGLLVSMTANSSFFDTIPSFFGASEEPPLTTIQAKEKPALTIMFVLGGHKNAPGRHIGDQTELSCTAALAAKLKEHIEQQWPAVRVVFSHRQDEILNIYQVATMANTLDVNYVISLHCFNRGDSKPSLYIYQTTCGNYFDNQQFSSPLMPAQLAYLDVFAQTNLFTSMVKQAFDGGPLTVHGPQALPCKVLAGVKVPACLLEFGARSTEDLLQHEHGIIQALEGIINPVIAHATANSEPATENETFL